MFLLSIIPPKSWWELNNLELPLLHMHWHTPPTFIVSDCLCFWYLTLLFSIMQFFIVLSCLISVSVNFSTFLVIGKTSAVTYQVLGHLKTCLVLAFGYVLLHDPFSWRNILGILIAIFGMVLYSYFCTRESQQKANEASAQLSQVIHILFPSVFMHLLPC